MSLLRLRIALCLSSPIYQLRRQLSTYLPRDYYTPTSAAYPLPIPRNPSSPPLQLPTDLLSKFDYTAPTNVWSIVKFLTDLSFLDIAAEYARLVGLAVPKDEETKTQIAKTCQRVIGGMCAEKRYEKAYELFHYFYNVNCLPPDYVSCCHVLDAISYQGRVDEAMKFYNRVKIYAQFRLMSSALLNAFINAERIDEAFDLFTNSSYEFLHVDFIRGYLARGNIDRATEIFEHLGGSNGHGSYVEEIAKSRVKAGERQGSH